ncbi:MAG: hypothetical protein WBA23_08870 [Tunicatimonas sp.]|uniref:hypothetical protein n=1 Tax=Tunicatimonas sp. TaxID=1940096 RepID=UPI003C737F58
MRHWISGLFLSTTICVGMTVKNLNEETIGIVERTIIEAHTGRLTGLLIQVSEQCLPAQEIQRNKVVSPISSVLVSQKQPDTLYWNMSKDQLQATLCPPQS